MFIFFSVVYVSNGAAFDTTGYEDLWLNDVSGGNGGGSKSVVLQMSGFLNLIPNSKPRNALCKIN